MKVPFNKPVVLPEMEAALLESLHSGHISGNGPATKKAEALLKKLSGTESLLCTSATHALEMMALLLNIQLGDEVILPSYTFVSTANAFALRGATLRFGDIDKFGNLRADEILRLKNSRTRAVVQVHYAGNCAPMENILEACGTVPLLEDAAQAIGSVYKGKALGTFGKLACLSFHETKNVGSGEGGALFVNDLSLLDRAEILREKGTNRRKFSQGLVDKYSWVDLGSSYVLSDLNAALLIPQLEQMDRIISKRRQIWERYEAELSSLLSAKNIRTLKNPPGCEGNAHLFAIIFENFESRQSLIKFMQNAGVIAPFHYVSLHRSPFGSRFMPGAKSEGIQELRQTDIFSNGLLRLPLYYNMEENEQSYVIDNIKTWLKNSPKS